MKKRIFCRILAKIVHSNSEYVNIFPRTTNKINKKGRWNKNWCLVKFDKIRTVFDRIHFPFLLICNAFNLTATFNHVMYDVIVLLSTSLIFFNLPVLPILKNKSNLCQVIGELLSRAFYSPIRPTSTLSCVSSTGRTHLSTRF